MSSQDNGSERSPNIRIGTYSLNREKLRRDPTVVLEYYHVYSSPTLDEIDEAIPGSKEWHNFWFVLSDKTRFAKEEDVQELHSLAQKKLSEIVKSFLDTTE